MMMNRSCLVVAAFSGVLLCGCLGGSSQTLNVVPVSGKVLYNGEPVEGAIVSFMGEEAPKSAVGETDAEGVFQLTTFDDNDGAVPGQHTVTITKIQEEGPKAESQPVSKAAARNLQLGAGQVARQFAKKKHLLPPKYADSKKSGLTRMVSADSTNDFTFELTD